MTLRLGDKNYLTTSPESLPEVLRGRLSLANDSLWDLDLIDPPQGWAGRVLEPRPTPAVSFPMVCAAFPGYLQDRAPLVISLLGTPTKPATVLWPHSH